MKITKKQVKAIDKGELTVRELFPEVFEVKIELGKWYKDPDNECLIKIQSKLYSRGTYMAYGFNTEGEWMDSTAFGTSGVRLATPEEVETALINEAKKRGFKLGVKYKGIFNDCDLTEILTNNKYRYSAYGDNTLCVYGNPTIFQDGVWAEIIAQPEPIELTVAEIEQKLNINNLKIVK